jgi:hypothetical protein
MVRMQSIDQPSRIDGDALDSGLTRLSWTNVPVRLPSAPDGKWALPAPGSVSPPAAPANLPPAQA